MYENLPPGGAKRAAYELGKYLSKRHQLDLYRLDVTSRAAFDLASHANLVFDYPYRPLFGLLNERFRRAKTALRINIFLRDLKRLHDRIASDIRARGYDVVFAHPDWLTNSPYLLRSLAGLPSVYYGQDVPRFAYERDLKDDYHATLGKGWVPIAMLGRLNATLALRRLASDDVSNVRAASAILVNSYHSLERFWATYARDPTVCYLGADTVAFAPAAAVRRRREILSVGSLHPSKGHGLVVEALGRLPASDRPALRVLTAIKDEAPWLRTLAAERRVSLEIESAATESELVDRYRGAIATVCAARLEPFGFTPLESMACGTPVVAVREGGYRESVVDGETGTLVDRDPDLLAAAIAAFVRDPARVEDVGRRGRRYVEERWTWERSGAKLEQVLERAVTTAGRGQRVAGEPAAVT